MGSVLALARTRLLMEMVAVLSLLPLVWGADSTILMDSPAASFFSKVLPAAATPSMVTVLPFMVVTV